MDRMALKAEDRPVVSLTIYVLRKGTHGEQLEDSKVDCDLQYTSTMVTNLSSWNVMIILENNE